MYPLTKKILSNYSHIHGNRYTHISLHTVKSSFTRRHTTYLEPPEVEYLRHGRNGRRTNFPQRQLQRGRRKHHNQWRRNLESFQGGNSDVVFLLHMSLLKNYFIFRNQFTMKHSYRPLTTVPQGSRKIIFKIKKMIIRL